MKSKLKRVLLIDDDYITNFLHQTVLKQADVSENIEIAETVSEALSMLKSLKEESDSCPDLIFLDLNMPLQNGWDFIEEYKTIKEQYHFNSVIVILTTSSNPDDEIRADRLKEVAALKRKPLTLGMINEIKNQYF